VREESARKKAKINKSSSKDSSEKVTNAANPQTSDAAAITTPPSKVSSAQTTSVKPPISIKAPAMYSLMDMITNPKGGGQVSSIAKVWKTYKDASSKGFAGRTKNTSSSADVGRSVVSEKAKIQDKNLAIAAPVLDTPGSKAKIQDKTQDKGLEASVEAQIQDKDVGKAAASGCLSLRNMSELRQIATNLGPLSDRSRFSSRMSPKSNLATFSALRQVEEFLPFDMTFDSVEVVDGPSLACDESLAITHASLRQYRELSRMKLDQDTLRKDLSVLETKVKEKLEALALSEKRAVDLSSEKDILCKSTEDFKTKVASLERQIEELDSSLAKAREANQDLGGKVDAADQEFAALAKAEKLRLSSLCDRVRDALVSVGTVPDQLPEGASVEHCQAWLTTNIPYVFKACRTFSNNAVHLAVRDLLYSLEAGGALAKDVCDSFSFISTDITPASLIEALVKFADHIDESFWSRVLVIGWQPQSEDSSDVSLSEFATPESSSDVSLREFASPGPSSQRLAHCEPLIEIFSSPSEINLSSDSDPLSPVEGGGGSFTFPLGSLVAIGRVYNSGSDASEGCRGRGRRGSRGRRSRGGPSYSRGSARKKRGGLGRRSLSVDSEGPSSRFDPASQIERMVSSEVVDPIFQRPYSSSSGYDFDEFSIVCQMLIELGLIVKQEPDDDSS
ncbi:hypothetical protein EJB05_50992, partial [Eragrostis curvula]